MSLAVKLALTPLLVAQALVTRARIPRLPEAAGDRAGEIGEGSPLRLLVAGDSSAAGVGVAMQRDALASPLAERIAARCGARVQWQLHARTGLTTAGTHALLRDTALGTIDVAVVVTGVNDVVEQVPSQRAVAARDALANWLRNACGALHVVYTPLPPVHQFPGLPQPLRWVAGSDARRHNAALRAWAATRRDVSCAELGITLDADGMAVDGFHPGMPVYAACVDGIADHVAAQVWPLLPPSERHLR
jgi:lysophospholipase L1-like esterase